MCGRFVAATTPAELATRFSAALTPEVQGHADPGPRFNVAPTLQVYTVATSRRTGERRLGSFRWGLVPSWATDISIGSRLINARVETVATKPAFRQAISRRRCIIPADAFYEWQRLERTRQPFLIRRRDGQPMAFAGLWEVWRAEHDTDGPLLRTCTIITTEANDAIAGLHDRMPAVLAAGAWDTWLDPSIQSWEAVRELVGPAPAADFVVYPVGTQVNNARNEGAQLALPLDGHDRFGGTTSPTGPAPRLVERED